MTAASIEFLGHATFAIHASSGESLLIDPYEPGAFGGKFRYRAIEDDYDFVVSTHDHIDHAAFDSLNGAPSRTLKAPFSIKRHELDHDEHDGRRRGGQVDALWIEVDGFSILHLSDVGHAPRPADIEALGNPDILLVPVGGFYTIGASQAYEWLTRLAPKTCIPMHYRSSAIDLPIQGVEGFLALCPTHARPGSSALPLDMSRSTGVVLLEPRQL